MRFGWLIPVVLLVVVAATVIGWMLARRAGERSGKKGWVANTGFLRDLPKYQALVRRTRSSLAMAVVCFIIAVIATSVSAGAPVDRYMKHDKSASRDIVLCLDASGSMLPYDSEIGDAFKQIISHFNGERISLQLWNTYSMTMFPLTDDYEMADDVLTEMAEQIDRGFSQIGNKIYFTNELEAYLKPRRAGPWLVMASPPACWASTTPTRSVRARSCSRPTTRYSAKAFTTCPKPSNSRRARA